MVSHPLVVRLRQETPVPLDVQFSCAPGDVLAIFGPSGSGKTTILRAIAGLSTPPQASVRVAGQTWTDTASRVTVPADRRRAGFVFQEYALFPHLSAVENVKVAMGHLPRHQRHGSAEALLRRVHLPLESGRRSVRTLSGGERQRVALARALAREPAVLLLDEPFSAVDHDVRRRLQDEVDGLRRSLEIPTVLVTHDIEDVFRLATHVLLLDRGRAVMCDTVAAVTSHPDAGAVRRLIGSGSVIDGVVESVDEARGLTAVGIKGQRLLTPALHLVVGTQVRVRVPAREVILATERPAGLSVHNILPATVTAVQAESGDALMIVQLSLGGLTLLAEVTRDAVQRLAIVPGRTVFALVKSVSVELVGAVPAE